MRYVDHCKSMSSHSHLKITKRSNRDTNPMAMNIQHVHEVFRHKVTSILIVAIYIINTRLYYIGSSLTPLNPHSFLVVSGCLGMSWVSILTGQDEYHLFGKSDEAWRQPLRLRCCLDKKSVASVDTGRVQNAPQSKARLQR